MDANTLLDRYEVVLNKFRTQPKTDHEIIISSWARVTQLLDERSFGEADPHKKRGMRLASRSIRHSLAKAGHLKDVDSDLSQEVVRAAYNTMSEVLESLVADADAMARLIAARHPHHRRLNACRVQLVRAFNTMARNIEQLRTGEVARPHDNEGADGEMMRGVSAPLG